MIVFWRKQASNDLEAIFDYIKKESPQNALMVFHKIYELANSLVVFPEKYPIEPTFNDPFVRFAVVWNYKLIYTYDKKRIYIVRIFSTRQNPKKLKP